MKKLLLIFALIGAFALQGHAQNANRSGVFLELGGGASIYEDWWSEENEVSGDINASIGYRFATSRAFAIEIKFEADFPIESDVNFSLMPGVRYTTPEIFGNTSLYFGANVGPGITIDSFFALKAGLTAGINITPKIYAGLFWDYTNVDGGNDHAVGARIGYRF